MCFHNGCVWDSFFDSPPPFFSLSIGFRVLYDFFFVFGEDKEFSYSGVYYGHTTLIFVCIIVGEKV